MKFKIMLSQPGLQLPARAEAGAQLSLAMMEVIEVDQLEETNNGRLS